MNMKSCTTGLSASSIVLSLYLHVRCDSPKTILVHCLENASHEKNRDHFQLQIENEREKLVYLRHLIKSLVFQV